MPITLAKELQGVMYSLYILTQIRLHPSETSVDITQVMYQSKGHFDDNFLPIIRREVTITNPQRVNTIKTIIKQDYKEAIYIVENFLVSNVGYYDGGVVTNGVV